jgi:hypothetical protein
MAGPNLNYLFTIQEAINFMSNQGYDTVSNINFENNMKIYRAAAYHDANGYLGYEFLKSSYVNEPYDGSGSTELWTKNVPIVTVDRVYFVDEDQVLDPVNDYEILEDSYIFMKKDSRYRYFKRGRKNWRIDYTAGWTGETLPGCIKIGCLKYVAWLVSMNMGGATTIGKSSITEGSGGMTAFDPDAQKKIFECMDDHVKVRF